MDQQARMKKITGMSVVACLIAMWAYVVFAPTEPLPVDHSTPQERRAVYLQIQRAEAKRNMDRRCADLENTAISKLSSNDLAMLRLCRGRD